MVRGQSFRLVEACNQYVGPFASNMQVQGSMNSRWLVTSAYLERLLQLDIGLPHGVCQQQWLEEHIRIGWVILHRSSFHTSIKRLLEARPLLHNTTEKCCYDGVHVQFVSFRRDILGSVSIAISPSAYRFSLGLQLQSFLAQMGFVLGGQNACEPYCKHWRLPHTRHFYTFCSVLQNTASPWRLASRDV